MSKRDLMRCKQGDSLKKRTVLSGSAPQRQISERAQKVMLHFMMFSFAKIQHYANDIFNSNGMMNTKERLLFWPDKAKQFFS